MSFFLQYFNTYFTIMNILVLIRHRNFKFQNQILLKMIMI